MLSDIQQEHGDQTVQSGQFNISQKWENINEKITVYQLCLPLMPCVVFATNFQA